MKIGRQDKLEVLGEFPISTLLLAKNGGTHKFKYGNKTYSVRMNNNRYKMFNRSMQCVACGTSGKRLFLERFQHGDRTPHFNLYAVEKGELVLMTKDHFLPRSCGGGNRQENLATMCFVCNQIKGSATFLGTGQIARTKRILMGNDGGHMGFWLVRKDIKDGNVVASNIGLFLNHNKAIAGEKAVAHMNRMKVKYYSGNNNKILSVWPQFMLSPLDGISRR